MDPNSARLAYTKQSPITVTRYVQNNPAVPPLPSDRLRDLETLAKWLEFLRITYTRITSHVQIRVEEKPNMARRPKFRLNERQPGLLFTEFNIPARLGQA
jgi:hypothetical protein